jgi:hypothetical protein
MLRRSDRRTPILENPLRKVDYGILGRDPRDSLGELATRLNPLVDALVVFVVEFEDENMRHPVL